MLEIDKISQFYEEQAKNEPNHLLYYIFNVHKNYEIRCGLSPARCFSPTISLRNIENQEKLISTTSNGLISLKH